MTRRHSPSSFVISIAGIATLAFVLTACGSDDGGKGTDGKSTGEPAAGSSVEVDKDVAALVPDAVAKKGSLTVGTDASYAPNEFFDEDGTTIVGLNIDLFDAVAAKMGLDTEWQNGGFDILINGVVGGKYDVSVSSFTINADRKKQVNMISYFSAGTQWAVAKDNPKDVDATDPCGLTVAVQTGTVQELDDLPVRQAECEDAGTPMDILSYDGQDEATAALVSGKADAMLADSPVIAYAVQQTDESIEPAGDVYDSAPYGYVVPKDDMELAEAISAALESLEADGTYEEILNDWQLTSGKVTDFAINP